MNKKTTLYIIATLLSLSLSLIAPVNYASAPQVVVTIKPIHALVSGVMDGVGTPYLLLSGGESPHSYSLRPSQVRQLRKAGVVIWVGPTIETFLTKMITTLSKKTYILRLIDLHGLSLLKVRKGKDWESHHYDEHPDNELQIDPHIWLDPENAKIIVQAIAQTLTKIDPNNSVHYQANASHLLDKLDKLDLSLKQQLASVKTVPFLVFHDAYQYFEHRYQLTVAGAINLSPENRPSVRRLYKLRVRLKKQQIRCVFSEPQFESALVATVIEGSSVRRGVLDPLGADLAIGVEAYFTLLNNMAHSLKQCLGKKNC
jgi:zinc transport system substrate-binding protein